jgi:hypothetical protein
MGLLSFLPESLSTINIIPGYYFGLWPVLLIIGVFLVSLVIMLAKNNVKWLPENFSDRLLILFFSFWLILSLSFTIHNYHDWLFNKSYQGYDLYNRSIIRVCSLDGPEGKLCRIFSALTDLRKNPEAYKIYFENDPIRKVYLDYYFFPTQLFLGF